MANPGFTDVLVSVPAKGVLTGPGVLFPARSHVLVRTKLVEAIQRREGVVVLTGESGAGKTTLCRSILRSLDPPTFVSEIVDSFVTIDDLLRQALSDFGASTAPPPVGGTSPHDLVLAIGRFLDSMPAAGRALLVIDEAHDVRPDVLAQLRTLANLQRPDGRSLQIILIGQPALDSLLARAELVPIRQRVTRRCQLGPLAADEIGPYVAHRFGGARGPSFRPAAMRAVGALSRGVPRIVNLLVDRACEIALERKLLAIGRDMIVESARRSAVHIPIGQRALTRRLALVAAVTITSSLSAWLLVSRLVPFARALLAAKLVVATPTASPSPPVRLNPVVTKSTPSTSTGASPTPAGTADPAPNAPPATVDPLPAADSFLVLAGSFRSARNAEASADRLSKLPLPAFARQEGDWNVVLVGPYVTPEEARQAQEQIGRDFPDAHVLRVRPPDAPK